MFGYLQGPMSTRVARAELDRARGDILKDTDKELVEQFDVERKFVLTMHEKIVADKVDVDTTNREQRKEEQEKALAELKEKIEDLEKAEDEFEPQTRSNCRRRREGNFGGPAEIRAFGITVVSIDP